MANGSGSPYCPRIYFLHPLLAGPLGDWPAQLERVAALGFDHVLVPPLFMPGREAHLFLTADHERLHPALGYAGAADDGLAALAQACKAAGLSLLMDLVFDRVAADGLLPQRHAPWFRREGDDLAPALDPRCPPGERGAARWRLEDAAVVEQALQWWTPRLQRWLDAGLAGICWQAPHRAPPQLARGVIEALHRKPGARVLAGTNGLAWSAFAQLERLGFDAVFASTAWWDFRSEWLFDEHARLRHIAPSVIATAEAPFGERLARRVNREDWAWRAGRRALGLAAAVGDGWLMPMGFEYGLRAPLHPALGSARDWRDAQRSAPYDLSADIRAVNAGLADSTASARAGLQPLTGPGSTVVALLRVPGGDPRFTDEALLVVANAGLEYPVSVTPAQLLGSGAADFTALVEGSDGTAVPLDAPLTLEGGELRRYRAQRRKPVLAPAITRSKRVLEAALKSPRVAIERVTPAVDEGRFLVKRIVGQTVRVEADIFMDGHEQVAAALLWRAADEGPWRQLRMQPIGNDRWAAEFALERMGRYLYTVEAWRDAWGGYQHEIEKKHAAQLPLRLELEEGRQMLAAAAARSQGELARQLLELEARLKSAQDEAECVALVLDAHTTALMQRADDRPFAARYEPPLQLDAERPGAAFASWYELFPRSMSHDERRHGTFDDVIRELPRVRDMGFDVLYFPPIHPIGRKHRKGRNNALRAGPDDVGSPYAIGAEEGGHDAIHPQLGTFEDFRRLRDAAREHGLELALDFAIQCAPDHPWLKEHPEWFAWRPDGTIKYAENPPKKYEDIVNVEFYGPGHAQDLWVALRDVILFWVDQGIRLFRVDNPHTKPLPFWKWMIADVRGRHPDVVFLSEAFTRPVLMRRLAKIGYSQSYTYFTWRTSKHELIEYLTELTRTEMREYFRPHFFVNTPDINPYFLQTGGRPAHLIRAALAATLSGLWGMYSGFELCEARALPGKEEYLDSEKYQLRAWDWNAPGNIAAEITQLNRIRRANPALHSHLGVSFYNAWNDNILYYGKATPTRDNVLLCAVNLDPQHAQEADFELPLWEFGLPDGGALAGEDLMSGARWTWQGKRQHLRLTPEMPFAIWRVHQ